MYERGAPGQARQAVTELLEAARLEPGDLLVVGCSSSEVGGHKIRFRFQPCRGGSRMSRAFIPC